MLQDCIYLTIEMQQMYKNGQISESLLIIGCHSLPLIKGTTGAMLEHFYIFNDMRSQIVIVSYMTFTY